MGRFGDFKRGLLWVGFLAVVLTGVVRNARADFTFSEPVNLGLNINSSSIDAGTSISADGCTLYFSSNRPVGRGGWDLWVATRPTTDADWGPPENLGPTVNTLSDDGPGCISADGLWLYFASNRPGGFGSYDTWVTTRATKGGEWGIPVNLGPTVNSATGDDHPSISADGLSLYFVSNRAGGSGSQDLWVTTRATLSDLWGSPVNLGPTVNSSDFEEWPGISADSLLLFFFSSRAGNGIWVTRRATVSDPWGLPVNLGPLVNTSANDFAPNVSVDGRTFYFTSDRPGGYGSFDLWQAPIIPVVDFNGDGIVDAADVCIIVDHWGENYPLCDIGPMPWGDGTVDVQDLIVLAGYLKPALVAHWPLDETESTIAVDSAGENDATLSGEPLWQPEGGQVGGALQLDGVDDCVITPFILNPADGQFSVFAWVQGGATGQVVLSQADGASWLCLDSVEGCLMTELRVQGRPKSLMSQTFINDGTWHRIGLVWDGSYRYLYVDGVEVAKDPAPLSGLESADGGLYFGVGITLAPGTFWSGLIDDIRIYNRVVSP